METAGTGNSSEVVCVSFDFAKGSREMLLQLKRDMRSRGLFSLLFKRWAILQPVYMPRRDLVRWRTRDDCYRDVY